jgi:hypothetical protein
MLVLVNPKILKTRNLWFCGSLCDFFKFLENVYNITGSFMFWNTWLWILRIALIPCRGLVQFKLCALLPAIRAPNSAGYQSAHCHSSPIGLSASSPMRVQHWYELLTDVVIAKFMGWLEKCSPNLAGYHYAYCHSF